MSQSRSAGWVVLSLASRVLIAILIAAALGFPVFVWSLARAAVDPEPADAIVALTGGEDRLPAAMHLLEERKGARLLISGVHQETTREDLKERIGGPSDLFACCVDLGRSAANTIGNAGETAVWVRDNDYHSLIVVTASYHMPRSMLELQAVLPETKFVAYPVFPERVKLDHWWSDPQTTGVLIGEYGKFLASLVRVTAATTFGMNKAAAPSAPTIERGAAQPAPQHDANAGKTG